MTHKKESEESVEQNLANTYIPKEKLKDLPMSNQINDEVKHKMDKLKKDVDKFAADIKAKFKFVEAIGIVPAQASKIIEREYELSEEDCKKELVHLLMVIPEEHFKEMNKIKLEVINISKKINEKFWVHILTPVDFWNLGLDSKFDIMEAFSMSFPVVDNSFLAAMRVTQIHKSLVLRKFEKYVTTYVVGGSLVRGEAKDTSDVDVFAIIDDTDVKRMSRIELRDKLRGIIHSYIQEALAISGTKIDLNVQVYLLTDFWEGVKDAHPVMFTFIRDGVPLYDRGAFLPWKSLLKMGRIKPSPEAVDMFMSSGDKLKENVDRRIFDIVVMDLYWGTLTPTQGLLMLYGQSPQGPRDTVNSFRETFVEKEKMIEKKYADILEEIAIKYYKAYEHGKIKPGDVDGKDLDRLSKNCLDFIERLKGLRKQIEKKIGEKSIDEIYKNIFSMLESLLKKKTETEIIKEFEDTLIKIGKFPHRYGVGLRFIAEMNKKFLSKKTDKKKKKKENLSEERNEIDRARKYSNEIVNALIEYTQRCDFLSMDRSRFVLKGKDFAAEVFFLENVFVVQGTSIRKLVGWKLHDSNADELQKQLIAQKSKENKIDYGALKSLKDELGDFELIY